MQLRAEPRPAGAFEQHPRREALLAEAHARPFHAAGAPASFAHFAFTTNTAQADADRRALEVFCRLWGEDAPDPSAKHHRITVEGVGLRWEQHTEFTTYTWEWAGRRLDADRSLLMRQLHQPGPLLACAEARLIAEPQIEIARHFSSPAAAMSYADDGAALIATDFQPDADGFVRFVVSDLALTPHRAGAWRRRSPRSSRNWRN